MSDQIPENDMLPVDEAQPDPAAGRPQPPQGSAPQPSGAEDTIGSSSPQPQEGLQRDPEDWATGDEPMTAAQRSYLDTLAKEAGEELPADMTKAEASQHIDRLQKGSNRVE